MKSPKIIPIGVALTITFLLTGCGGGSNSVTQLTTENNISVDTNTTPVYYDLNTTLNQIGDINITLQNGIFQGFDKNSSTITTQTELVNYILQNYDLTLQSNKTILSKPVIGIKMTKTSSGSSYYYVVDSNTSYVQIAKTDKSGYIGTSNVTNPVTLSSTLCKLNFSSIIDYLILSGYSTLSEMSTRFTSKESYQMEIYATNMEIGGAQKLSNPVVFELTNVKSQIFPIGSSKLEGNITIQ
ncbi:MAG: hypothetical protein PHW64_01200 [Sulfuricurvum sp.]|nr:hypothetical protein [Sulfuricurvum sp.]